MFQIEETGGERKDPVRGRDSQTEFLSQQVINECWGGGDSAL